MFTIEYVKNLEWQDAEHTVFSCVVKYEEFNEEHPSAINATDPYAHINEIWTKGNAGEYGVIAEYVAPTPAPTPTAEDNKALALLKLEKSAWAEDPAIADPAVSNPYLTNQAEFLAYRNLCRQVVANPVAGFDVCPIKPNEVWSS